MGKGIQDAIHDRAEKDRISRQVRELWIAAQSMMDSLRSNATVHLPWNEQRRPLNLNGLNQALNNNDEFASAVLESIPQSAVSQGILPQGALKVKSLCSSLKFSLKENKRNYLLGTLPEC